MFKGDAVEVLRKKGNPVHDTIVDIFDGNGQAVPFIQPGRRAVVAMHHDFDANDLIRRKDSA